MKQIKNTIPVVQNPENKSWIQPDLSELDIRDQKVFMTEETFQKLRERIPFKTGTVYEGKIWKVKNAVIEKWKLCWYDYTKTKDCCVIKDRWINIVE